VFTVTKSISPSSVESICPNSHTSSVPPQSVRERAIQPSSHCAHSVIDLAWTEWRNYSSHPSYSGIWRRSHAPTKRLASPSPYSKTAFCVANTYLPFTRGHTHARREGGRAPSHPPPPPRARKKAIEKFQGPPRRRTEERREL